MNTTVRRRVVVRKSDSLIINGYEVDGAILASIVNPENRLLWTFVRAKNGVDIQPVAYSEERVVWLTDDDLIRRSDSAG